MAGHGSLGLNSHCEAVKAVLMILTPIVAGFNTPLSSGHVSFLFDAVLVLHRPNAKLTITSSVLGVYHEPLVHCLTKYASRQPSLIIPIMKQVCLELFLVLDPHNSH